MNFIEYFLKNYKHKINRSYKLIHVSTKDGEILTIMYFGLFPDRFGLFRAQVNDEKDLCEITVANYYPELKKVFEQASRDFEDYMYPLVYKKIKVRYVLEEHKSV